MRYVRSTAATVPTSPNLCSVPPAAAAGGGAPFGASGGAASSRGGDRGGAGRCGGGHGDHHRAVPAQRLELRAPLRDEAVHGGVAVRAGGLVGGAR